MEQHVDVHRASATRGILLACVKTVQWNCCLNWPFTVIKHYWDEHPHHVYQMQANWNKKMAEVFMQKIKTVEENSGSIGQIMLNITALFTLCFCFYFKCVISYGFLFVCLQEMEVIFVLCYMWINLRQLISCVSGIFLSHLEVVEAFVKEFVYNKRLSD